MSADGSGGFFDALIGGSAFAQTVLCLIAALALAALWMRARTREETRRFGGALLFLLTAAVLEMLLPWLPASLAMSRVFLTAGALLALSFGLVRGAVVWADLVARRRKAEFSTIFRDLLTIFLYGVVVLVVLRVTVAVDVTPLLATSALVTAVVGLALQETLGNVFSGLSLQLQKPFAPGDWIRFGSYLGRVQGIGWRSTALVTRALEILDVPNSVLAREVITNYRGRGMGDDLFVGIVYGTPPNRVKETILGVLRHVREVVSEPAPQIWVVDYGDFAIKYRIRFWMVDYGRQDQVRDEIMTRLWYAFRRDGIEIPFPIRTLYMREVKSRAPTELEAEDRAALRKVDFLSGLSDEELSVFAPAIHPVQFGTGETICREGDPGDSFFIIRRGRLDVVASGPDGRENHVAELGAPSFFGEMSLLTGEPRSATIRARTDAELLEVERDGMERLFEMRPELAAKISTVVAQRQTELRERRERMAVNETPEMRSRSLLAKMQAIFRF